MTQQRISVVIPCYNSASFLQQALQSVMDQTRAVDEIIVVDDGSTDGSAALARQAGVTCISLESNMGPGAARNRGILAATGDLIAFLDADDYWMPTHVAQVADLLERYPQSAVGYSRIQRFGDEDVIAPAHVPEGPPSFIFWQLIEENIVAQSSAIVRRETLMRNGCYNPSLRYSEDYDLWLRLARRYPFVCTDDVTAGYRVHADQASRNVTEMVRGRWQVKHQFWKKSREKESAAFMTELETQMLRAFSYGLQTAWDERDETLLRAVLAIHDLVPNSDKSYRQWARRFRLGWPLWRALSDAWGRLRPSIRQAVRPLLSTLLVSTDPRAPFPDHLPLPDEELD